MPSSRPALLRLALLAALPLAGSPILSPCAAAQGSGTLQVPPAGGSRAAPGATPQSAPPQAVPRTPVQRAAPAPHPHAPEPHRTPVVQAPKQPAGEKPAASAHPSAAARSGAPGQAKGAHPAKPGAPAPAPAVSTAPAPPAAPAEPEKPAEPPKGSSTGLPLPRFASLRSDDVNLRIGPGTRYPIEWVYKRRDLPVEIEREKDVWRLVRAPDDVKGWVHQATLTGRRSFVVTGAERVIRERATDDAAAVARLKPGVVGRLRTCEAGSDWCQVQVQDYRGWMKRSELWGVYPGEAVQ